MKRKSVGKLYDWKVLCSKKDRLTTLRRYSTGAEQAAYRAMLEDCIKEMEALTPEIVEIFRRIKRQSVMNDIVAIYFGGSSYACVKIGLNQKSPFSKGHWFSPITIFKA